MTQFCDEIRRIFPDVEPWVSAGDADLPYVVMGCVADWLKSLSPAGLTPAIVQRVTSFAKWCKVQPRGKTAADDVLTIFTVAFVEHLFSSAVTRSLLPKLC